MLEELDAAGSQFDRVAGVSLGSLVAASVAAGLHARGALRVVRARFVDTNPTQRLRHRRRTRCSAAHKARRLLAEAFGERRIEELPLRFFCLSCDLIAREPVVHRTGRVVDAVYPSLAIPGVFPPVATPDGRLLVDGGVLDNLPVATMARTGEGPVIAVDVTGGAAISASSSSPLVDRLRTPVRRALTGSEAEIPRLGETIMRTVTVGSIDTAAAARDCTPTS